MKYRAAIWSFFPFLKLTALYFTISDIVHKDLYKVGTIGTTRLLLEGLLVRPKEQTHAEFYGACPVFVTTYLHTFLSRILNASFMKKKYLPSFLCFFCCCLYLCVCDKAIKICRQFITLIQVHCIGQLVPFWVPMYFVLPSLR